MKFSPQIRWITATTLGLALVGFGLHFPGGGGPDWDLSAAVFGAVLGAISGVIVGFLQWLMLRSVLRGPWSAVLSMAVGIGFSHALADGGGFSLGHAPVAVASALVLTAALALAYAERRPTPLAASFVGWSAGWLIADAVRTGLRLPWTEDPLGWSTDHAVAGIVAGIVWGGLTAAAGFPTRGAVASSRALRREG